MKQRTESRLRLWIDDVRDPPDEEWIVARSSDEAIKLMSEIHFDFISFDHDLGGNDTAMRVFDFIERKFYEDDVSFHFHWNIHSANPIGKDNLERALSRLFQKIELKRYAKVEVEYFRSLRTDPPSQKRKLRK